MVMKISGFTFLDGHPLKTTVGYIRSAVGFQESQCNLCFSITDKQISLCLLVYLAGIFPFLNMDCLLYPDIKNLAQNLFAYTSRCSWQKVQANSFLRSWEPSTRSWSRFFSIFSSPKNIFCYIVFRLVIICYHFGIAVIHHHLKTHLAKASHSGHFI